MMFLFITTKFGEILSTKYRKTIENNIDKISETTKVIFTRSPLFFISARNFCNAISNPRIENSEIKPAVDMIAVANPTSYGVYNLAEITQKRIPEIANVKEARIKKIEFLIR